MWCSSSSRANDDKIEIGREQADDCLTAAGPGHFRTRSNFLFFLQPPTPHRENSFKNLLKNYITQYINFHKH